MPLSFKILASPTCSFNLDDIFARSLVLSKLWNNIHIPVLAPKAIKTLNGAYMRVVRRLADRVRFEAGCGTDIEARKIIQWLAIDCIMIQKWLLYLVRLVLSDFDQLLSLKQQ